MRRRAAPKDRAGKPRRRGRRSPRAAEDTGDVAQVNARLKLKFSDVVAGLVQSRMMLI
jgi:hypothetical protein